MASELIGVTCYRLRISIDAAATPPSPPSSAGAGERFFSIKAKYLHLIPLSLLPPGHPPSCSQHVIVRHDHFLRLGPEAVRRLLAAGMGLRPLPDDDAVARFAPAMARFAADAAAASGAAAVVPVRMTVTAVTFTPAEEVDRALEESAAEVRTVPASESAVEALEAVATTDRALGRCTICLEELAVLDSDQGDHDRDRTAVKTPCSHVFHRDCVVRWFEKSHLCPLCRYAMPTTTTSS